MKRLLLLLTAFLTISSFAFSQGHFLKKGENGFGLSGQGVFTKQAKGLGVAVGYSIKGRFDISASYAHLAPYKKRYYNTTESNIGFLLEYHLLKNKKALPSGITLHAGTLYGITKRYGHNHYHNSLVIGTDLYAGLKMAGSAGFTPVVSISYMLDTESTDISYFSINPMGILSFELSENNRLFVGGGIVINDSEPYYNVTVGVVL